MTRRRSILETAILQLQKLRARPPSGLRGCHALDRACWKLADDVTSLDVPNEFFSKSSASTVDSVRVIMFNPETNRSEGVSRAIAQEILRRRGPEGRTLPLALEDFIDRHVGPDRQLTLWLSSWPA